MRHSPPDCSRGTRPCLLLLTPFLAREVLSPWPLALTPNPTKKPSLVSCFSHQPPLLKATRALLLSPCQAPCSAVWLFGWEVTGSPEGGESGRLWDPLCCGLVTKLFVTLCDPMDIAHQAPLSMGFPRQEYWSGLPFPSPGDLSNSGIDPKSPALLADTVPSEPPGKRTSLHLHG